MSHAARGLSPGGALGLIARESRGALGRLLFLIACVAIGVAAVVAVAGLSAGMEEGLRVKSRELLAADLTVQAARPLPDALGTALAEIVPGVERTDVRELATMAAALSADGEIGRSRLCELKVVRGEYPFYGELLLAPPGRLSERLGEETAVVAAELLAGLDLGVGDPIRIGGADFRVAGTVVDEPDRLDFSLAFGPRVFLSEEAFARTSLLPNDGAGSRVTYRALLRLPGNTGSEEVRAVRARLASALEHEPHLRFETHADSQRGLRRGIERFRSYLGLVALLSLILGGIGVAQVTRSWLDTRALSVAVWKSLGVRPREILFLYLFQALLCAALGSVVGALLGGTVPYLVPRLAPDLLEPGLVRAWQPLALARGVALGVGVSALFALTALTALWRVPPALVLRSNAEPLAAPRGVRLVALLLLATGLTAGAWIQCQRLDLALWFTGGLAALGLALYLGARALVRGVRRLPRTRLGPYLAHGLAALARPGSSTVAAIVALGFGALVVIAMALVETRLESELRGALPDDAPSVFLTDVQPDQWSRVHSLLEEAGATGIVSVPVVMTRLAAIDGVPVEDLASRSWSEGRSRWALTREQRLTWFPELPASNTLVRGELWSVPSQAELSVEEEFARRLQVDLGSRLTFDVQGVPFEFVVSSVRAVEWESLMINFHLAVEPGVLEDAPQLLLAAARLDPALEQGLQDRLVEELPNVVLLRVRPVLEKLAAILERIAWGVRLLGSLTVLAGLVVLAGAIGATQVRRSAEAALLKTFGVPRSGIVFLFASEFALAGALAGVLGGLGAWLLAGGFLREVLELEADLPLAPLFLGMLVIVLLSVLAGLAASTRALAVRPGRVLRG